MEIEDDLDGTWLAGRDSKGFLDVVQSEMVCYQWLHVNLPLGDRSQGLRYPDRALSDTVVDKTGIEDFEAVVVRHSHCAAAPQ